MIKFIILMGSNLATFDNEGEEHRGKERKRDEGFFQFNYGLHI